MRSICLWRLLTLTLMAFASVFALTADAGPKLGAAEWQCEFERKFESQRTPCGERMRSAR